MSAAMNADPGHAHARYAAGKTALRIIAASLTRGQADLPTRHHATPPACPDRSLEVAAQGGRRKQRRKIFLSTIAAAEKRQARKSCQRCREF